MKTPQLSQQSFSSEGVAGSPGCTLDAGFTLVEVMVATSCMLVAVAGALALFGTYSRSWVITNLQRDTAGAASMALERMVYGVDSEGGLREAQGETVNVDSSGAGWVLSYDEDRFLRYDSHLGTIVNENGSVICENLVGASAIETNRGCALSVEVFESGGGRTAAKRMSSFVYFRN